MWWFLFAALGCEVRAEGSGHTIRCEQGVASATLFEHSKKTTLPIPGGSELWFAEAGDRLEVVDQKGKTYTFSLAPEVAVRLSRQGPVVYFGDHPYVELAVGKDGVLTVANTTKTVVRGQTVRVPCEDEGELAWSLGDDSGVLHPRFVHLKADELQSSLSISALEFPVEPDLSVDLTRANNTVYLHRAGPLSFGDDLINQTPWGFGAVRLKNSLTVSVDVLVGLSSDEPALQAPSGALGPMQSRVVMVRLRPNHETTVRLPIWVDAQTSTGSYPYKIEVCALQQEICTQSEPHHLQVVSSRRAWWVLFGLSCFTGALGWIALYGMGVSRRFNVAELSTIALFAGCLAASLGGLSLVGGVVAALSGPLAPFLTGFANDVAFTLLIGVLIGLVPKPGAAALTIVVAAGVRMLLFASVHPVELFITGNTVFFVEGFLLLFGAYKHTSALRLGLALGLAGAFTSAIGLIGSAVLYRMHYAPAYSAALIIGPGLLYPLIASQFTVPVAAHLKRVLP